MKLYENKGKKYLEDEGILKEVIDNKNIDQYVEEYQSELVLKDFNNLELNNLKDSLDRENYILEERKDVERIIIPFIIVVFSIIGLLAKDFLANFGISIILSTALEIGTYAMYGTKKKNKKVIGNLEELREELEKRKDNLERKRELINNCLENNYEEVNDNIREEEMNKPLVRTLEKGKF